MDDFLSSGDMSELSIPDDHTVSTPSCPICHKQYNYRCKPMTLQPCGHGLCMSCLQVLQGNSSLDAIALCPLCRDPIENEKPNWDLREITNNVNHDLKTGFWENQILQMHCLRGRKVAFSKEVRAYAKAICVRLAYEDTFIAMKRTSTSWSDVEVAAVSEIKNALVRSVLLADDNVDTALLWVNVLSFPACVENYLVKFFMKWFDSKDFLEELDGVWLLDAMTQPV